MNEVDPSWALNIVAIAVGPTLLIAFLVGLGYLFGFLAEVCGFVARQFRRL